MRLTLFTLALALQSAPTAQVPVSIEEYLSLKRVTTVHVAPDGGALAFTVAESDLESNRVRTRLYIWRPEQGARVLVGAFGDVDEARWSHDGAQLAFIAPSAYAATAEDTVPQIWIQSVRDGGAAYRASDLVGDLLDFGWAPDGSIYALAHSTSRGIGEFWRILIPSGTADYVWGGDRDIRDMAVSPDGKFIAFSSRSGDGSGYDLELLDLAARRVRRLTRRPGSEIAPVWSPDGRSVVFRAPQNPELAGSQTELFLISVSGGSPQPLTLAFDRTIIEHRWPPGGDLLFTAALGPHTHLFARRGDGAVQALTSGAFNYGTFDAGAVGARIYAVRESAGQAQELWRIDGSQVQRLTELNTRTDRWRTGHQEWVRWTAPDGLSVEGLLVYPADYQPGRRYPLLVELDAGPSRRVRDVLHQLHGYQLFAAHGYAVLAPNFRGVPGYGERFATASRRDVAGGDLADLLAGVDHVVEMGVADPTRLGIYGHGYGALLVDWSITRTAKFAVALSMHGTYEMEAGSSGLLGRELASLTAAQLHGFQDDLARGAVALAANVRTPLLLIERSAADPPDSPARLMHRALRDLGRAVEYLSLPIGGREIGEARQRAELFFRQLRWFDRHLKFGGAELFDFYLVDEWVPGENGWKLRVTNVETRAVYPDYAPAAGRYLEITITIQPDTGAVVNGTIVGLELDLGSSVRLIDGAQNAQPPAGTVADLFGQRRLLPEAIGTISVPLPANGPPTGLVITMAFEIAGRPAEYRLRVAGFRPVRIWAPEDAVGNR